MPRLFQRIQSGLSVGSGAVAGLSPMFSVRLREAISTTGYAG